MQHPETRTAVRKKDYLIGICHALGEDFGFNPDYLRIALAVMLLVNAEVTLIAYGITGVLVLASRLLTRHSSAPVTPSGL